MKMRRFDDAYEKVSDGKGEFLFSYYECGIDSSMAEEKKNELVDKRENYLQFQKDEQEEFERR